MTFLENAIAISLAVLFSVGTGSLLMWLWFWSLNARLRAERLIRRHPDEPAVKPQP